MNFHNMDRACNWGCSHEHLIWKFVVQLYDLHLLNIVGVTGGLGEKPQSDMGEGGPTECGQVGFDCGKELREEGRACW